MFGGLVISPPWAEGRPTPAGLMFCNGYFIFRFLLFNDRLEQSDLRIYKTYLRQIFRIGIGRHDIDVQCSICFAIGQRTLPWQPILGSESV